MKKVKSYQLQNAASTIEVPSARSLIESDDAMKQILERTLLQVKELALKPKIRPHGTRTVLADSRE